MTRPTGTQGPSGPRFQVIDDGESTERDAYQVPGCTTSGSIRSRFARPEGFDEWIVTATLERGASLTWSPDHGDQALYVEDGLVEVAGRACGSGGAVVVESAATPVVRALEDSRVLHVGSGVGREPGGGVHVVDRDGLARSDGQPPTSILSFFANGRCPGCELMLYRVAGSGNTSAHHHTQPQLQHVLEGTIRVGRMTAGPGMTFAVPAGYWYGYRSDGPWQLVVYRPGVSQMRYRRSRELLSEGDQFVGAAPFPAAYRSP